MFDQKDDGVQSKEEEHDRDSQKELKNEERDRGGVRKTLSTCEMNLDCYVTYHISVLSDIIRTWRARKDMAVPQPYSCSQLAVTINGYTVLYKANDRYTSNIFYEQTPACLH